MKLGMEEKALQGGFVKLWIEGAISGLSVGPAPGIPGGCSYLWQDFWE